MICPHCNKPIGLRSIFDKEYETVFHEEKFLQYREKIWNIMIVDKTQLLEAEAESNPTSISNQIENWLCLNDLKLLDMVCNENK